jgi:hypothetical protein
MQSQLAWKSFAYVEAVITALVTIGCFVKLVDLPPALLELMRWILIIHAVRILPRAAQEMIVLMGGAIKGGLPIHSDRAAAIDSRTSSGA